MTSPTRSSPTHPAKTPLAYAEAVSAIDFLVRTYEQSALLWRGSPPEVAAAFCASRVAGDWGQTFGTLDGTTSFDVLLTRAMPR